ncbi:MAG: hypothetical protein M1813_009717 [Trichoglossum hirsutum]|nr:MAG: hypothetical protein M1813_009717 [Trichoglossum hirsutum]
MFDMGLYLSQLHGSGVLMQELCIYNKSGSLCVVELLEHRRCAVGITLNPDAFPIPLTVTTSSPSATAPPTTVIATLSTNAVAASASAPITPAKQHLSTGASIGIGVGATITGVLIFMVLALVGWKISKRKGKRDEEGGEEDGEEKKDMVVSEGQRQRTEYVGELPAGFEGVEAGGRWIANEAGGRRVEDKSHMRE